MDPETFLDMANQVTKLKMYPYFDLAHSAACLLAIREEMGAGQSRGEGKMQLSGYKVALCLLVCCPSSYWNKVPGLVGLEIVNWNFSLT